MKGVKGERECATQLHAYAFLGRYVNASNSKEVATTERSCVEYCYIFDLSMLSYIRIHKVQV